MSHDVLHNTTDVDKVFLDDIFELIGEGLTNRQIGERMFLAAGHLCLARAEGPHVTFGPSSGQAV